MISVVGGGPVGAFVAFLLAKKGFKVRVFEEHKVVGSPVQCTGIVTPYLKKFVKSDDFVVNRLGSVRVHSGCGSVDLKTKELVIDRSLFDKYLMDMALGEGVKLSLSHRFKGFNKNNLVFSKGRSFRRGVLVGADGPLSVVGRSVGISNKSFYFGLQAVVKLKHDPGFFEVFFGSGFPGFFGWVVPESDRLCRVGLAAKSGSKHLFDGFLRSVAKGCGVVSRQAGLIPVFDPGMSISKGDVFLVGDSAGMVKASTGGGLVSGLRGAQVLSDCIVSKKDYGFAFGSSVGLNLRLHLLVRRVLDRFDDKDYDGLVSLVSDVKVKRILNSSDREYPLKLLARLAFAQPKLLLFLKKLFV